MPLIVILTLVLLAAIVIDCIHRRESKREGEAYTEFYILGPKGELPIIQPNSWAGYTPDGHHRYWKPRVPIGHHLHGETYAIESRLNNATNRLGTVVSATLLDRFSVTVPHNQTGGAALLLPDHGPGCKQAGTPSLQGRRPQEGSQRTVSSLPVTATSTSGCGHCLSGRAQIGIKRASTWSVLPFFWEEMQ